MTTDQRLMEIIDQLSEEFPDSIYMTIMFKDRMVEAYDSKQLASVIPMLCDSVEKLMELRVGQVAANN